MRNRAVTDGGELTHSYSVESGGEVKITVLRQCKFVVKFALSEVWVQRCVMVKQGD